jgi:F0F1-type ATP synthase assembly protein I
MLRERRPIDPETKNMWRVVGSAGAIGFEIAIAIAVGYFGGTFLDKKLGTKPWLMIFGLVAGVGAAIKALVRLTRDYKRSSGGGDDADPRAH